MTDPADLAAAEAAVREAARVVDLLRDELGQCVLAVHDSGHAAAAIARRDAVAAALDAARTTWAAAQRALRLRCADCLHAAEHDAEVRYCRRHAWVTRL